MLPLVAVSLSLFREFDFLLSPSIQMVVEHAASGGIFKDFDNKPALMVR